MSSTISRTLVKTLTPRPVARLKMEEKQHKSKLVRSSSIEKFKKFNSYICSQHYYIVPALLTWLRSSQFALKLSAEKTILVFRSILFNMNPVILLPNIYECCAKSLENTAVLYLSVYLASVMAYGHLVACIYLLSNVHIPSGLYFLLIAFSYITFLCYKSIVFDKKIRKRKVQ